MKENRTVDPKEIAHFASMADSWWDAHGKFKPLHELNPVRMQFIRDHMATHFNRDITQNTPFSGLHVLDIGCGGGLVCEPMARLGATVTGIDATAENIDVARTHASQMELAVDYRHTTAEALAEQATQYDVVMALEIIEHVADVDAFLDAATALLKPHGLLFMSTLNRTAKSFAFAIVGAEYVLRWLPKGTHHWNKFLKPSELVLPLETRGLQTAELIGLHYNPISREWRQSPHQLEVNYMLVAKN